jgi:SanA protein
MRAGIRRKLLRTMLVAGALSALALGALLGTNAWVARAAGARTYAATDAVPSRSIAIVPGSRVYGGKPLGLLRGRLETALMLYRGGRVKKILVSGIDTNALSEATVMSAWLRERGVDSADILVDRGGSRTRETMDRAAGIFDVSDAVICTQDVNAARSVYLAEAAGIDAVAVAVPSTLGQSARYMRDEAFKTALAFFESLFRRGASRRTAERAVHAAIATR